MNVTAAEKRLLSAATNYSQTGAKADLLSAAVTYGKAKMQAWHSRDKWKAKKRLGDGK